MVSRTVSDDTPGSGLDDNQGISSGAEEDDQGVLPSNGVHMSDMDATVTRASADPVPAARKIDDYQGKTVSK
jgi:hypothetical protein